MIRQNFAGSLRTSEVSLSSLQTEVASIRERMIGLECQMKAEIGEADPQLRQSASNLIHYLSLRQTDIRLLQEQLAQLGLSSLGRTEAHVLDNVNAVLDILEKLTGNPVPVIHGIKDCVDYYSGRNLLKRNTEMLLGPVPERRRVRIMVTMPSEAAENYKLVKDLLLQGMNLMRINCAHDDSTEWEKMISNLRRAERATGQKCRILMDLAGPKLRTGAIKKGIPVLKIKPKRDRFGSIQETAKLWLTPAEHPENSPFHADAVLQLPSTALEGMREGSNLKLNDLRGKERTLKVNSRVGQNLWGEISNTAYLSSSTRIKISEKQFFQLDQLPEEEDPIILCVGDTLILMSEHVEGTPSQRDKKGRLISPSRISCSLPEVFSDVKMGESIWFDDGKIGGLIKSVTPKEIKIEITQTPSSGARLRADKGINLPDSDLKLAALTQKDLEDLPFIAAHADMIALSFVQHENDVLLLQEKLAELNSKTLGIVLKIETRRAFERLPRLLLAAMKSYPVGVMIARGDLAVECGYERLAEVQEEILWLSEAAHVPAIWATQVLENLAQKGYPSRAEITDAAMSVRAECVMLNKGPHIVLAVSTLDNILRRMLDHQEKKSPRLRQLSLSNFLS